jgi:hypothetical protein
MPLWSPVGFAHSSGWQLLAFTNPIVSAGLAIC